MNALSNPRRALSRWLMHRRVRRNGNNHSEALNRHYREYHRQARGGFDAKRHPIPDAVREPAAQLSQDGFLVLPPESWSDDAAALKTAVDAAFAEPGACYDLGPGAWRLMDGIERFPRILDVLGGNNEALLHAYFGSYFKIYSATVYRTYPEEFAPHSSFLWHFDNAPDLQLKVMVYLDDVSDDTGAFRFKSKAVSEQARAAGFWHRDDYDLGRPVFEDEASTHVVAGPPGTTVIFQPGRVVHKATAPSREHRDVAVIVINPSKIYWREHLARNRHLLSTNAGLCLDLDTDKTENIGYRF